MSGARFEKNRRRIRWNTLRIFSGRERRRCQQIVCRSRMALLGQTPKAEKKELAKEEHDGYDSRHENLPVDLESRMLRYS